MSKRLTDLGQQAPTNPGNLKWFPVGVTDTKFKNYSNIIRILIFKASFAYNTFYK